ncbi:hypothetical protein [Brevibacillus parabrevis]|uniref:hypothetical protein n=1 Tax=Brevibacillus parabrevis TaxID=54914 RepID=UPI002E1F9196|nr:prenyltransferase/squalene oxidase repeat-containing protein [Brevibacillus parabrevis]
MLQVRQEINRIQSLLLSQQKQDGSWRFCLESSPTTDAHMIILLRTLGIDDERLIDGLVTRIAALQQENGAWKLYPDEAEGNLSTTLDCYCAMLFSRRYQKNDPRLVPAREFIRAKGGLTEANLPTKFAAALTGQYKWPAHFLVPVEIALLPPSSPVSFYDFVGYARVHLAPMMIAAVWDTSLLAHALQQSGLSANHPAIASANRYLLSKQQHTYGDWKIRNPAGTAIASSGLCSLLATSSTNMVHPVRRGCHWPRLVGAGGVVGRIGTSLL